MLYPSIFFLSLQHDNFSKWQNHLSSCFPKQDITVLPFENYLNQKSFYQANIQKLFCITDNEDILPFLQKGNSEELTLPVAGILPNHPCTEFFNSSDFISAIEPAWDLTKLSYLFEGIESLDLDSISWVYSRFHQLPLTILETKRLRLREWSVNDLFELQSLYQTFLNNPSIVCPWTSEKESQNWLDAYCLGAYDFFGYGLWCVEKIDTGDIIGQCGIEYKEINSYAEGTLQLQYMILPDYQGNGYAEEICLAICHYAKEQLKLSELSAYIHPGNKASIALIKKLGFHFIDSIQIENVWFKRFLKA